MRVIMRNKWVTLRGSSYVRDENEVDLLKVQGRFFTFTRKKYLQDLDGNTLYIIRNKFWILFARKAFIMDPDKNIIARIRRKVFSLHDHYDVVSDKYGDIVLRGNILNYDYHIYVNGQEIGHVSRKISMRDSFVLDVDDNYDWKYFVALLIAIDNITDQRRTDASSLNTSIN